MRVLITRFVAVPIAFAIGCMPTPAPVIDPAACTYDRCGLWLASGKVHRGTSGELLTRLSLLAPPSLERYMAGNDSAILLARQYRSFQTQAAVAGLIAAPVVVFAPVVLLAGIGGGSPRPGVTAAMVGGLASLTFVIVRSGQASAKIGRAVFLYNRDLPRTSTDSVKSRAGLPPSPPRP